jgi:hypothetical protein
MSVPVGADAVSSCGVVVVLVLDSREDGSRL